jgi:hypothetical protein
VIKYQIVINIELKFHKLFKMHITEDGLQMACVWFLRANIDKKKIEIICQHTALQQKKLLK